MARHLHAQVAVLPLLALGFFLFCSSARGQERLPQLQVGAQLYSDVTVVSRSATHVNFRHAKGMATVKVADLDSQTRQQLGFPASLDQPKRGFRLSPKMEALRAKWKKELAVYRETMGPSLVIEVGLTAAILYFAWCFCAMSICHRVGQKPGLLVWLPVVQVLPLLRAAGMAPWLIVLMLIPVINIFFYAAWCFRIAAARQKSALTALMLLFPLTSIFALLYLAFSEGIEPESEGKIKLSYAS